MDTGLQRIDVKLLLAASADFDLDAFLVIFDRWRQRKEHPSDWVDLADYAHMPSGPGILIAGKRDTFSVNLNPPGPGLLTSTRRGLEGDLAARFRAAFDRARALNAAVLAEPEFPASLAPDDGAWEVCVNDRLRFPNDDASDRRIRPALAAALGADPAALLRHADPGGRLGYSVRLEANR